MNEINRKQTFFSLNHHHINISFKREECSRAKMLEGQQNGIYTQQKKL